MKQKTLQLGLVSKSNSEKHVDDGKFCDCVDECLLVDEKPNANFTDLRLNKNNEIVLENKIVISENIVQKSLQAHRRPHTSCREFKDGSNDPQLMF